MMKRKNLSKYLLLQIANITLPYDDLEGIRARMSEISPNLTRYDAVESANYFLQAAVLAEVKQQASVRLNLCSAAHTCSFRSCQSLMPRVNSFAKMKHLTLCDDLQSDLLFLW